MIAFGLAISGYVFFDFHFIYKSILISSMPLLPKRKPRSSKNLSTLYYVLP